MSITRVVAITGCDSGLGWALAARSAREGIVTIAGMFQGTNTKAAEALRKLCAYPYSLDVTNAESIEGFKTYVDSVLDSNPNYRLHALVNNAGVMTIGNYEWQTQAMIESPIKINLLGSMRVGSAFLPALRRSATEAKNANDVKPRIINVASHCGLQPLPGFAAYSATKAGVLAWTKALRLEHRMQGLGAVAFVPGGFVNSSSIIAGQVAHFHEMINNLSDEQKSVYETKISKLTEYLGHAVNPNTRYDSMKDEVIIETFMNALTDENPKELYKVESWRYMFYYNILKLPLPINVYHWLIKRFVNFPELE